ncbi:DNA gyrase/topoisomerase IV subunit B [Haliangium ochraceum]|uniref:DNA topoisomerase (ATP-hydrolyzing) n=1 Tax=Haliangium ochraceum (strain DSM 14365 / JCM 11303 / SMP-2) TaxID=502025 RepID=D0LGV7_HALO1|nr:DNA topoisomerase IV subunit B [Haliangium ochraceum]ACY14679.1 DNA topoisomerase (ATP-hydrolyzing) [Haliangium ochraceum DSM 14365]
MAQSSYTAQDITVLEGLEPVRKRPAMYIGGTDKVGFHHLLWEIVDNSIDEVINKHATRVDVTLHDDGTRVTIEDNGRGIPIDTLPKYKKPALEIIMTTLHAGGKFERGKNYKHSGGLHGVGASVVNALSSELIAEVKRDGDLYQQTYERGVPTGKMKKAGSSRGSGTIITFTPDPQIFGKKQRFDAKHIAERLEAKSYLHRGVKLVLHDKLSKPNATHTYQHDQGIAEYLSKLLGDRQYPTVPTKMDGLYFERAGEEDGDIDLEVALVWTEAPDEYIRSYVNGIPTPAGGTHEQGLKSAVVKGMRNYMNTHKLVPKGITLTAEDIREGLVVILSCYVGDPQFQGQTKQRLNNTEVSAQVDGALRPAIERYFNQNQNIAEAVVARMILAARARIASRAASQAVSRKTAVSHRLNLPGKLADCSSTNPGDSELFIVEGDSAGGSAKQGRDRRTQAILPLRGKVLNAEQASTQKLLANKELSDIVSALGCGMGPKLDLSRLRYGKIFLLMDADADGHHIATLLLTFFYRHMRQLIDHGHVYLAQPPLYRIDLGKETFWALDDIHKDQILANARSNAKPNITRFKGLGEMNPSVLKKTTLDPRYRSALRITVPEGEALGTDQTIAQLMGKDASARYDIITDGIHEVDELDV